VRSVWPQVHSAQFLLHVSGRLSIGALQAMGSDQFLEVGES
jgi:hypothetical protein